MAVANPFNRKLNLFGLEAHGAKMILLQVVDFDSRICCMLAFEEKGSADRRDPERESNGKSGPALQWGLNKASHISGLWLVGNEGMERMETTIMGYI